MRKHGFIALFILLILALGSLLALTACDSFSSAPDSDIASQVVRIHIRANSNSQEDQNVKLCVRDAVTAYLTTKLEGCKNKSDALNALKKEKQNIIKISETTLYDNGFEYKASATLNVEHFPDRTYDGYDFPAGDYDALILNLGSGSGDNWWCVAFPPLCFIPDTKDGEKIVYKSWVKEKIEQIFGGKKK